MAQIIDGKAIAAKVKAQVKEEAAALVRDRGITPGLAVVLVGDNSASKVYVRNKERACKEVGFVSRKHVLPEDTSQEELLALIDALNGDSAVHGILVQLPLPGHLDEKAVIARIRPEKDVDAFHVENAGRILLGDYGFLPCTPAGILTLLKESGIAIQGKECVVVGRSYIVGKPMALMMLGENATVTVCHSRTENLAEVTRRADILIVAIGRAKFVTADMVKEGAVVIDVGMDRDEEGKLCGDVDFDTVEQKASYITPVPGGVGPMTIATLMRNTLTAAQRAAR